MEEMGERRSYIIYSTHIDPHTINLAPLRIFPSGIATEDVSRERLEKYFERKDNYYQVKSEIRSRVAFSVHNYMGTMRRSVSGDIGQHGPIRGPVLYSESAIEDLQQKIKATTKDTKILLYIEMYFVCLVIAFLEAPSGLEPLNKGLADNVTFAVLFIRFAL
jgi:hypothetical protein